MEVSRRHVLAGMIGGAAAAVAGRRTVLSAVGGLPIGQSAASAGSPGRAGSDLGTRGRRATTHRPGAVPSDDAFEAGAQGPADADGETVGPDAEGGWTIPAGDGVTLRVTARPFTLALVDTTGRQVVATVPGAGGLPLDLPELDGPEPVVPAGAASGRPGVAFLVGVDGGIEVPSATYWMGNRLLGGRVGVLAPVLAVRTAIRHGSGLRCSVAVAVAGSVRGTTTEDVGPGRTATADVLTGTVDVVPVRSGGVLVTVTPPAELPAAATVLGFVSPADEALYGLGGRKDAFDQRGLVRTLWCDQENVGAGPLGPVADPVLGSTYTFPNGAQAAYYDQAVLFGSRGWVAWVGQSTVGEVDLAASHTTTVVWGTASPRVQLLLAGGGLQAASAAYTAIAGRAPAPPTWAYQPWMDVINQQSEGDAAPDGSGFTGGAAVAARVRTVVEQCARHDIPLGVVGMEGWQAVPDVAGLAAELRGRGLHLSAYWNPFISPRSPVYAEAAAAGYLVRGPDGQPFLFLDTRFNETALVDFTNAHAAWWWRTQLDRSMALGFEGFMHDFGEQVSEPMVLADGQPPSAAHNAYPVLYHRAARVAVDAFAAQHPGFEPFFYVRSGYSALAEVLPAPTPPGTTPGRPAAARQLPGRSTGPDPLAVAGTPGVTASTPGVFPGDETTDWSPSSGIASVVPCMLNLALGGCTAFTTDVGGYLDLYTPQTTAELFTRWSQLAAMTAISRIHNSTIHGSVYPWDFDAATLDTYRRYARAKVRLAPLVDTWARRAATTGAIGPVRPLVLVDGSSAARRVGDQWLLGDDLLVAPILVEGARARSVYLPRGARWERVVVGDDGAFVPTGDVADGGTSVTAPAPLTDIPLFIRRPR